MGSSRCQVKSSSELDDFSNFLNGLCSVYECVYSIRTINDDDNNDDHNNDDNDSEHVEVLARLGHGRLLGVEAHLGQDVSSHLQCVQRAGQGGRSGPGPGSGPGQALDSHLTSASTSFVHLSKADLLQHSHQQLVHVVLKSS